MIIAFSLQGEGQFPAKSYAPLMVESVKRNTKATLVQLSNESFPALDGIDEIIRVPSPGDFILWAWEAGKRLFECYNDNILTIGTDMIVQDDVSKVFDLDFDVALSPYPKRTRTDGTYCGDGIFWKPSGFGLLAEMLKIYKSDKSIQDGWEGSQTALMRAIRTGRWKVLDLDFDTYNFTPDRPGMDLSKAKIVHYRGPRKEFMPLDHGHLISGFPVNSPTKTMIENAEVNLSRDIPLIVQCEPNNSSALIVCGEKLPNRQGAIFSVNAHDNLIEHGVVPDFHVAVDENIKPHKDVTYLVSAQCNPSVFEKLRDYNVIMWLSRMNYGERDLAEKFKHKPIMTIGGSESVELKAMLLAHLAGFRNQHIYGMKHTKEFEWTCRLLGKEGAAIYVHS